MAMACNVGGKDRTVRLILGVVLAGLAFFGVLSGIWATVSYVVAAIALLTSLLKYCPANQLLGINSCPRETESNA